MIENAIIPNLGKAEFNRKLKLEKIENLPSWNLIETRYLHKCHFFRVEARYFHGIG